MNGTISEEIEVKVGASEAWKLYNSLEFGKIIKEALPTLIDKIDIVEGDGGVGTIAHLFLLPGSEGGGTKSFKEKFTLVDNEKRVKEVEVVEGGYLDLGFTLYRTRFEIIENAGEENKCIIRSTIEYEVKEEAAAIVALVSIQPLVDITNVAAKYLLQNNNSADEV